MGKKSIYAQLEARAVQPHNLLPSPRYQNPGMFRYRGKLWLAYRYHRMETPTKRSGIGICEISSTGEVLSKSQRIELSNPTDTEHHEDCRLFVFRNEPHISYTEMVGYVPGVNYTCVMKCARLNLTGTRWNVVEEFHPRYGNNSGFSKEKNWVFFENAGRLYCTYAMAPEHIVLEVDGERILKEYRTRSPVWHWGHMRGGTPPIDLGDGRMLNIFHSSIPTEIPPHYVRYYAAAYTMEAKPPFRVLEISQTPIMAGSEEDGHRVDPRFTEGWKPYVVFPCGLVPDGDGWLTSFGVNDWQCAVGRLSVGQLKLGPTDGNSFKPRFFRTDNGSLPIKYVSADQKPTFIHWEVVRAGRGCSAGTGYMVCASPREAVEVAETDGIHEIMEDEYCRAMRKPVAV